MPNITILATTTALTAFETKITNVSNLVKKTDYNIKISEIEKETFDDNHDNYITTPEFSTFTTEIFDLILKRENLASKSDIANFIKKTDFDNKLKDVTSNEHELNKLSKKLKQYQQKY